MPAVLPADAAVALCLLAAFVAGRRAQALIQAHADVKDSRGKYHNARRARLVRAVAVVPVVAIAVVTGVLVYYLLTRA